MLIFSLKCLPPLFDHLDKQRRFVVRPQTELSRRLRRGEMETTADYMRALDLPGFCQERTSAREEYTPPFDLTGV